MGSTRRRKRIPQHKRSRRVKQAYGGKRYRATIKKRRRRIGRTMQKGGGKEKRTWRQYLGSYWPEGKPTAAQPPPPPPLPLPPRRKPISKIKPSRRQSVRIINTGYQRDSVCNFGKCSPQPAPTNYCCIECGLDADEKPYISKLIFKGVPMEQGTKGGLGMGQYGAVTEWTPHPLYEDQARQEGIPNLAVKSLLRAPEVINEARVSRILATINWSTTTEGRNPVIPSYVVVVDDCSFIIMHKGEGSLIDLLPELAKKGISTEDNIRIRREIYKKTVNAVKYLNDKHLWYTDLKLENILYKIGTAYDNIEIYLGDIGGIVYFPGVPKTEADMKRLEILGDITDGQEVEVLQSGDWKWATIMSKVEGNQGMYEAHIHGDGEGEMTQFHRNQIRTQQQGLFTYAAYMTPRTMYIIGVQRDHGGNDLLEMIEITPQFKRNYYHQIVALIPQLGLLGGGSGEAWRTSQHFYDYTADIAINTLYDKLRPAGEWPDLTALNREDTLKQFQNYLEYKDYPNLFRVIEKYWNASDKTCAQDVASNLVELASALDNDRHPGLHAWTE